MFIDILCSRFRRKALFQTADGCEMLRSCGKAKVGLRWGDITPQLVLLESTSPQPFLGRTTKTKKYTHDFFLDFECRR